MPMPFYRRLPGDVGEPCRACNHPLEEEVQTNHHLLPMEKETVSGMISFEKSQTIYKEPANT